MKEQEVISLMQSWDGSFDLFPWGGGLGGLGGVEDFEKKFLCS